MLAVQCPRGQPGKLLSPPGQLPCKARAALGGGSQLTQASFCLCRGSGAAEKLPKHRAHPVASHLLCTSSVVPRKQNQKK